ncbi:MAG: GIY-YIG nuclease family protein [Clostridia bacterium]|nr:GIY-YIG nuclease family protein [Clostridia bacterium]
MFFVYILANSTNTVIYIGVTNNLQRRIYEHKFELFEGFTKKYHIHKLVYYETYANINDAIMREKKLKGLLRKKKDELIGSTNPNWEDLSLRLFPDIFR